MRSFYAAAAVTTLRIQIALCCPAGMLPIDSAAPSDAASEKVTPPGAVPSFPTAVSVPLMAETPRPICISVDDDDVFDIHTLAF